MNDLSKTVTTWLGKYQSSNTKKMYENRIRMLQLWIAPTKLEDATPTDLLDAAVRYDRQKNPSNASWNQMMGIWRSYYSHLGKLGVRTDNPSLILTRRDEGDMLQDTPSAVEVEQLWSALVNPAVLAAATPKTQERILRDRAIFALLVTTGMRNFEVCSLLVSSFDFQKRHITFTAKGQRDEYVAWPAQVDDHLIRYIKGRPSDEPAFWNLNRTAAISDEGLNDFLRDLCEGTGVKQYTAHAFRRYFATEALKKYNLQDVAKAMRHRSPKTTMRYDAEKNTQKAIGTLP